MSTKRPEVRVATIERVDDALVEFYGYDRERVDRMGFGASVDLLLDNIEDE